jgi:hypothetical protein
MRNRSNFALAVLAAGLYWGNARAQDASAPPASTPAPTHSKQASAKDRNKPPANMPDAPAPSQSVAPGAASPDQSASPAAPQANAPAPQANSPTKPSTAADNPFPEDLSRQAAAAAAKADAHAAASAPDASQSSGTATPDSSSLDGLDKLGIENGSRTRLKLESPDGATDVYDPKRATEDVRVGKYYMKTGDYKGAYDRFKDATLYDHEDAEAVFWLAEAARKMNHPQEATQNYQVYLAAVPDGPNAKVARKALGELAVAAKPSDQHP